MADHEATEDDRRWCDRKLHARCGGRESCEERTLQTFPVRLELDEYEVANLRDGLLFLRAVGGDTGDWMGQILMKLPEVERAPNVSCQEQRRQLAIRVGWRVLYG